MWNVGEEPHPRCTDTRVLCGVWPCCPCGHSPGELCALLSSRTLLAVLSVHRVSLLSPVLCWPPLGTVLLHHYAHASPVPTKRCPITLPTQTILSFHADSRPKLSPQWHCRAAPAFCAQTDAQLAVTEARTAPCAWQWL